MTGFNGKAGGHRNESSFGLKVSFDSFGCRRMRRIYIYYDTTMDITVHRNGNYDRSRHVHPLHKKTQNEPLFHTFLSCLLTADGQVTGPYNPDGNADSADRVKRHSGLADRIRESFLRQKSWWVIALTLGGAAVPDDSGAAGGD